MGSYIGKKPTDVPLTSSDINDNIITSAKIVNGTIVDADINASAAIAESKLGVTSYDDNKLQSNIALLGFKTAVNGSLAKYNLQDQIIDEYTDATGIDAGASTNEILSSGAYYGGTVGTINNYYGDDSDGALTTSGNVTHTVANKNGSYDGDMVVKQYSSLTIGSGHTMTTDQPCRGMLIYVSGNCSIAGTLTMSARGGSANPTSSTASSDGNVVNAAGLQMGLFTASAGSSTLTNAATNFNGFGTAVRTAFANQSNADSNGTIFTLTRTGGAAIRTTGAGNQNGATGTAGTLSGTSMGTGAGGASGIGSITGGNSPYSGAGGAFGGGSGAAGLRGAADASGKVADQEYGDAGEGAWSAGGGSSCASGGTGNPGGAGADGGETGTSGTGGIIILIVGGTLTITGTVSANGVAAVNGSNCAIGGASGGGAVMLLHKGTLSNSGTVQAIGGATTWFIHHPPVTN